MRRGSSPLDGVRSPFGVRRVAAAAAIPPYLNDPAAIATAMTVGGVSADALSYTTTSSAAAYAIPIPPAGSVIEFDITCSNVVYLRLDGDADMTVPNYTELVAGGIPAGTQRVSVTVPSYTDRAYIGFRSAGSGHTVQITNWRVSPPAVQAHPLQAFFASGAITIYLDSDGATRNGAGQVTAIANRGAGGAAFNAAVVGNPIPLTGNALQMSASTGNIILSTAANIDGVRMMWACSTEALVNFMRFFGSPNDEIRMGTAVSGTSPVQLWSNRSGAGVAATSSPRVTFPTSGMHLMELETNLAAGTGLFCFDGPQVSAFAGITHTAFSVDRIGQGTGATLQFVGRMGGVLGVVTGRPDTAAAIAAVRSYWAARFGLTLT